jgi:hypothetical protein
VSQWTNSQATNAYISEHRPTGIPTVVFVNQDGEIRSTAGWSRGAAENNLDWLVAN